MSKYFLCGPFPQSPGELSWTHFYVSIPYPLSIGLPDSLAYSRCSIHVYEMKSLFLRAWWGSTAEHIQWALFPMNSPCVKPWSWWELNCWKDWLSPDPGGERSMYGKVWGLRASLRCDESEYTPVSEASLLYSRTVGVPSRASFSPGASIQNSFFSNSSVFKIPLPP